MMKQEMQDVLQNNILRFWLDKMQDREHGGFYGRSRRHTAYWVIKSIWMLPRVPKIISLSIL